METNLIYLLAGLVGLFSTLLKLAIDIKNKGASPDEKYKSDMADFDKAIASGDADSITLAFEQLRRESEKRNSNSGRSDSNKAQ